MKDSYSDDIMLCFVQGFNDKSDHRNRNSNDHIVEANNNNVRLPQKKLRPQVSMIAEDGGSDYSVELRDKSTQPLGKHLKLSSGDKFLKNLPEVKRSFSDRFSVIGDGGKRSSKGFLTIRKTRFVVIFLMFF